MDAIVTAGGIPLPEEPLYPYCEGRAKAMVDVAGKPMIQWVLDALSSARTIKNVIIVALTEKSGVTCKKRLYFVPNQGKMLDNLRAGVEKALEINKRARHVLLVSSDIPAITGEMVDWVVEAAIETDDDIYYNVIPREVMEERFPGSKRTYTHLKDMDVCGGDMNVARAKMVTGEIGIWEKIANARKNPLKQAALIGYDAFFALIFRQMTLERAVEKVAKRLNITGRAIVCPYAEVGMDVDKPHQLELVREDLATPKKRKKKAVGKKPKKGVKKAGKPSQKTAGKLKAAREKTKKAAR